MTFFYKSCRTSRTQPRTQSPGLESKAQLSHGVRSVLPSSVGLWRHDWLVWGPQGRSTCPTWACGLSTFLPQPDISQTLCLLLPPLLPPFNMSGQKQTGKEGKRCFGGHTSAFVLVLFLTKSVKEEVWRPKVELGKSNLKWKEQCFSELKRF